MKFKFIKNAKISVKLTAIYALMFIIVLFLLNASVLYGVKYYLYGQGSKQLDDAEVIILNKISSQNQHTDLSQMEFSSDVPIDENIHMRIMLSDGRIINISDKFKYDIKLKEPYNKIMNFEGRGGHLLYENIKVESKDYGTVYIQAVKVMDKEYDFMEILLLFMGIADFIGVIVSIILGYITSMRMLKPIADITKTAENISINNLKERIDVKGPDDELKRLGDTFNKMINGLQESFDRQNQFVSDASHELRTPISVIQGYANLLDRWGKDDRKALEKSIHAIKLETANMVDLIEKLLFLAKGDSDTHGIEKKEFYINDLINEVASESKLIAGNRIISNDFNDPALVFADYKMIKQMLRVFVDNSIKFTGEYGKIDISSKLHQHCIDITVSDNGIGIPKEELKYIFNRFYTVDKSRSKDKGGTGLGLSIAKWIVDMHQGTIEVESEEEKGTRISVRFER